MIRSKNAADRSAASSKNSNSTRESSFTAATAVSASPKSSFVEGGRPAAVIGPKIRFKGEIVGEEDLLIEGEVEGTIDLKGFNLTVGPQGVVKANLLAETIVIEGTVEGDVYGEERISIKSSSDVSGNLVGNTVTLENGAKFNGSVDMKIESRQAEFESFSSESTISRSPISKPVADASISDISAKDKQDAQVG